MTLILGWPDATENTRRIGFRPAVKSQRKTDAPVRANNGESHWLCAAPTGAGKTRGFVISQLLDYPGSAVVVDVKGEIAQVTARYRRQIGEVLVIDPFKTVTQGGGTFNPLAHLDTDDPDYADDIFTLSDLFNNQTIDNDRFWDDSAQNVIAGLMAAVVHLAKKSGKDAAYFHEIHEKFHTENRMYELAKMLDLNGDLPPLASAFIGQFLSTNETTRASIAAVVAQQLRMLASPGVQHSFAGDTGAVDRLIEGRPVTVYIVLRPDRLSSHSGFVRIILTAIMQRLMRRITRPHHPTLFLVDEAAQLGKLASLETAVTLGRGYGIRVAMLVQSLSQLERAYGEGHKVFLENMALMTMGSPNNMAASRALAEFGFGDVTAEAVHALTRGQVMVKDAGVPTRRLRKLDYLGDKVFAGRFDPNPAYGPPCDNSGEQLRLFG